jgi:CBS domain-containing protein
MNTVKSLLEHKGNQIYSISPDDAVYTALELMAQKDTGAVMVMKNGHLAGILTERDYARKVILRGKASKDTPVGEIMSTDYYPVRPDQTIYECMALMSALRIRYLPVVDNDQLVGVVSITDVVREIIRQQGETIQFLQDLELDG